MTPGHQLLLSEERLSVSMRPSNPVASMAIERPSKGVTVGILPHKYDQNATELGSRCSAVRIPEKLFLLGGTSQACPLLEQDLKLTWRWKEVNDHRVGRSECCTCDLKLARSSIPRANSEAEHISLARLSILPLIARYDQ